MCATNTTTPTADVVQRGRRLALSGLLRIDEVAEATGFRAPEGEYDTIGGLVLRDPRPHPRPRASRSSCTAFDPDGAASTTRGAGWPRVIRMDGRRIDRLSSTRARRRRGARRRRSSMGDDLFGVLLTVLLLGGNAFFVGAEFALISARRDRLEALAEQGKKQRRHGHPRRREPLADARRCAAGHHHLLDPAGPGRRARGRAPAREAVRAARHPRHLAAPVSFASRWRSW